jgi:hypothetical protein
MPHETPFASVGTAASSCSKNAVARAIASSRERGAMPCALAGKRLSGARRLTGGSRLSITDA